MVSIGISRAVVHDALPTVVRQRDQHGGRRQEQQIDSGEATRCRRPPHPRDVAQVFRAEKILALRGQHYDLNYLRFVHADGRYYEFAADLMTSQYSTQRNRLVAPDVLSDIVDRGNAFPVGLGEPVIDNDSFSDVIEPLRFDENYNRFRRIANMITTRSDVFEIRVTVQSGTGTDANGDRRINWRDDREFTALATKRARTVYER